MGDGGQRMPGGQSRWSAGKDLSWEPVRIERVCEVKYDHMQGDRFRHAATFLRWRDDKAPRGLPLRSARSYSGFRAFRRFRCISRYAAICSGVASAHGIRNRRQFRLLGTQRFRHVLQIDPNAPPRRRSPAHRIGQDVGRLKVLDDLRMLRPSTVPSRASASSFFVECAITISGCFETRRPVPVVFGSVCEATPVEATPSWGCRTFSLVTAARVLAHRALRVLRRPRRIALPFLFVTRRQLEQRFERAGWRSISACRSPLRLEPRRHGLQREVGGIAGDRSRPRSAASRRAHRDAAAPKRPSRRSCPSRSGCSR